MKGMKIGIDFGSSSLKIYAEGKGVVVDEPSIVAVETETGKPIAFGKAADSVYGRTVDDIKVIKVIRNGVCSVHCHIGAFQDQRLIGHHLFCIQGVQ